MAWPVAMTDDSASPRSATALELALVIALTLLAAALRLWRIGDLPPGPHVDEAFNILDARAVLEGWRPVFLPANAGREVLYTYLQAPLLALVGDSLGVARLASALVGTLAVPATWWLARGLPLERAGRVGLLAAALLTLSYWHLHFSRFGIRAVLFPLVVALALGVWWRVRTQPATRPGSRFPARGPLALGILLGAAVYAHPAGRGLVVIPVLDAALSWLRWREVRPLRVLAAAVVVAVAVSLPLALYWARHPWLFGGHAQEVSILGGGPEALARNALRVAAMFHLAGDPAPWRNVGARPVFDLAAGALFLYGLWLVAAEAWRPRRRDDAAVLVLVSLIVLLVPTVATDAAPNFSRAIGALPIVVLLPALGLDRLAHRAGARFGRRVAAAAIAGVLLWSGAATLQAYFVRFARDPVTPLAFDADKVALARAMDARAAVGRGAYLSSWAADHPTVRVAAATTPRGFDPAHGFVLPASGPGGAEYLFLDTEPERAARDALVSVAAAAGYEPEPRTLTLPLDASPPLAPAGWAPPTVEIGAVRLAGGEPEPTPPRAVFGFGPDATRASTEALVGLDSWSHAALRPGAPFTITLTWRSLSPPSRDLTTFVHVVDASGGNVAGADAPPVGGTYPTTWWRPGERVVSRHVATLPPDLPAGAYTLRIGWYDPDTGLRLRAHAPGPRLADDGTAYVIAPLRLPDD